MTDEEIKQIAREQLKAISYGMPMPRSWKEIVTFARALLAASTASDKQEAVALACWSCGRPYTEEQRRAADGHCPHCSAEIHLNTEQDSDAALLDWLRDGCCDLRCISLPTPGGDDSDVRWTVIEHHMAEPREREIGRSFTDNPRDAIRDAIKRDSK